MGFEFLLRNDEFLAIPALLRVCSPQCKVVQHNGRSGADIQRGSARSILSNVDKVIAEADLLWRQS